MKSTNWMRPFLPAPHILFDGNSRRIPRHLEEATVCDPNTNMSFRLVEQPEVKLSERLARLVEFFPANTKFVSPAEFEELIAALVATIEGGEQMRSALEGSHFPICLPQIESGDYGEIFDSVFTDTMGRSYEQQFPERKFYNRRKGTLGKQTKVVDKNHGNLVALMTRGPVVGVLTFPLQGFSVHAQREQMAGLPEFVSLGGGFDVATAMTAYPETLARDYNTLGLDMSALEWQSREDSLSLRASGDRLGFGNRQYLGVAMDNYSGALFFRG